MTMGKGRKPTGTGKNGHITVAFLLGKSVDRAGLVLKCVLNMKILSRASEVGSPTNPPWAPGSDKTRGQGSLHVKHLS